GFAFLIKHADWPDEKPIRLRTEQAALTEKPKAETMQRFCDQFPPISGRGMIACAIGNASTPQQRETWIHQGWLQGDFSPNEETLILDTYGNTLPEQDHIARTDRLLFEGKATPARRMLPLVPQSRTNLYLARIALIGDAPDAASRINSVPEDLKRDPGLIFD